MALHHDLTLKQKYYTIAEGKVTLQKLRLNRRETLGPFVRYLAKPSASAIALVLSGCGAPSFTLFGAYFPGWMFCAAIGLLAAISARAAFVSTGWSDILPYQLFVCASIGTIVGLLVWLLWFGR